MKLDQQIIAAVQYVLQWIRANLRKCVIRFSFSVENINWNIFRGVVLILKGWKEHSDFDGRTPW